jgi:hypothetical protein
MDKIHTHSKDMYMVICIYTCIHAYMYMSLYMYVYMICMYTNSYKQECKAHKRNLLAEADCFTAFVNTNYDGTMVGGRSVSSTPVLSAINAFPGGS